MTNETQTIQFDDRVDRYLLGKMTEAEELEFEIEYLDNPDLLAEVEMVERLIRGLKLNESAQVVPPSQAAAKVAKPKTPGLSQRIGQWLQEWFTPQTGWGAVAATVFLVPTMMLLNPPAEQADQVQGTYVHILGQKVRSSKKIEEVVYIEPNQTHVVIGFTTEPSFSAPEPVTVKVFDEQNQLVWQQAGLNPDYRWSVYLSITSEELQPGIYTYELSSNGQVTGRGEFGLKHIEQ